MTRPVGTPSHIYKYTNARGKEQENQIKFML